MPDCVIGLLDVEENGKGGTGDRNALSDVVGEPDEEVSGG